jgi:hypothetical protein
VIAYRFRVFWNHIRNRTCQTCKHLDIFRSSGDGQVSKRHAFCRNPVSPHFNHPIPGEAWCPHYQRDATHQE